MTDTKRETKERKSDYVGFRAKESMKKRIKAVAIKERRSESQIAEMCVEQYLEVLENKYGIHPNSDQEIEAEEVDKAYLEATNHKKTKGK